MGETTPRLSVGGAALVDLAGLLEVSQAGGLQAQCNLPLLVQLLTFGQFGRQGFWGSRGRPFAHLGQSDLEALQLAVDLLRRRGQ